MGQTSFGRMESFIFLYIWNQKCSIQYPVLHNYYTAWFSLVRLFFVSQVWQNDLFVRKFKSEIFKKKKKKFYINTDLVYSKNVLKTAK